MSHHQLQQTHSRPVLSTPQLPILSSVVAVTSLSGSYMNSSKLSLSSLALPKYYHSRANAFKAVTGHVTTNASSAQSTVVRQHSSTARTSSGTPTRNTLTWLGVQHTSVTLRVANMALSLAAGSQGRITAIGTSQAMLGRKSSELSHIYYTLSLNIQLAIGNPSSKLVGSEHYIFVWDLSSSEISQ